MRIAMYTDTFVPYISGVSTAVVMLANTLAENGHAVFIQAPGPKEEVDLSFLHPRVTVKYVRAVDIVIYPDFRLGTNLPLSLQDIREFAPDLIHVHTPLSVGLEGFLISRRLHLPLIQTFHTYFMDQEALKILGIRNERLARLISRGGWRLNRVLTRWCDVTIAPTNYVAKDLRQHAAAEPIVVCPNILPANAFARHPQARAHAETLLFVGRLSLEKRIDLLIQAYALARQTVPNLKLTIIGDGPERQNLFDLALNLHASDGIRWFGKIPHYELMTQHLYHEGDIFVTLSRFETYGYTTLEAMAHELPVIALSSRANTEVIGKSGLLVPDTTQRERAIRSVARKIITATQLPLKPLRHAAYEQALHYHPSQLLPRYEAIYQQAIADHREANGVEA